MNSAPSPSMTVPAEDAVELHGIVLSRSWIAEFCRRHHVRSFALFGSILRDDFGPESDIDVLVEFEPGKTPGFGFFGMQDELTERFGRQVDLNTPQCLSKYFRDEVVSGARPL